MKGRLRLYVLPSILKETRLFEGSFPGADSPHSSQQKAKLKKQEIQKAARSRCNGTST